MSRQEDFVPGLQVATRAQAQTTSIDGYNGIRFGKTAIIRLADKKAGLKQNTAFSTCLFADFGRIESERRFGKAAYRSKAISTNWH